MYGVNTIIIYTEFIAMDTTDGVYKIYLKTDIKLYLIYHFISMMQFLMIKRITYCYMEINVFWKLIKIWIRIISLIRKILLN